MTRNVSLEYALVTNLHNAAVSHKQHCADEGCNVSLFQLLTAARYIWNNRLNNVFAAPNAEEVAEIDQLFKDWPLV
jgi:hypothetical protein